MDTEAGGTFKRTDLWREGEWLDLWSVVHFLSGVSIGLGFYLLHFGVSASIVIALLSLILYEMWETLVGIEETPANRFMDVVVGMVSFLPSFLFVAPALSRNHLVLTFGFVLAADAVMNIFGWRASQKAAALEKRLRAHYAIQRALLVKQENRLRKTFRLRERRDK